MQNQEDLFLISKSEWKEVNLPHSGFTARRFCLPELRHTIDGALLFVEPSKAISVHKNVKNGQEVLCPLKSALQLVHGDKALTMVQDDAVHLWSRPELQLDSKPRRRVGRGCVGGNHVGAACAAWLTFSFRGGT